MHSTTDIMSTLDAPAAAGPSDHRWYPPGTHITVRGLSKKFGATTLYDNFDLDIPRGQLISVFGPNGCGKSTLINMMSGIMPIDAGQVLFDGKDLKDTRIGYVFQNYREAMFPWLRAIDNLRYPLKFLDLTRAEKDAKVEQMIARFDVKIDLHRYPYELSGGQQQMVSIMRALIVDPEVLFMDEPFSALDYEMTLFMREQLQKVFMETRTTTLLVSHDLEEAVHLADKVLLLTRKPTRIADIIPFDAPRPRNTETLSSPDFVRVKAHSLEVFQREVRKS